MKHHNILKSYKTEQNHDWDLETFKNNTDDQSAVQLNEIKHSKKNTNTSNTYK